MTSFDLKTAKESWYQEMRSAYLYRIIAKNEGKDYQLLFNQLAKEAEIQATTWGDVIRKQNGEIPIFRPDLRSIIAGKLIEIFGAKQVRTILAALKVRGMSIYSTVKPGHPIPKSIEDVGRGHKSISNSNNLRASIFGINDGLVSNASLIMGMAGANADSKTIILAGIAGLLAGAFSMGAGEYVSVRSQREMFEYQIGLEKKELELYPEEEKEELALIYQARGLSKEEAHTIAGQLMHDPKVALDTLAREELGLNPDDLVSPIGAAIFSFIFFTVGALIPLVPFLFANSSSTLFISIGVTGISLFIVGATMSLFTGRSAIKSGFRMLLIGGIAGVVTYLIGNLLGVNLG